MELPLTRLTSSSHCPLISIQRHIYRISSKIHFMRYDFMIFHDHLLTSYSSYYSWRQSNLFPLTKYVTYFLGNGKKNGNGRPSSSYGAPPAPSSSYGAPPSSSYGAPPTNGRKIKMKNLSLNKMLSDFFTRYTLNLINVFEQRDLVCTDF